VIYQDLMRITRGDREKAIFRENPALLDAIRKSKGHTLHIWGLLSDGSVHSHIDHLMALLDLAASNGAAKVAVHAVLDGRDKPPRSALPFIDAVEAQVEAAWAADGSRPSRDVTSRWISCDQEARDESVEAWTDASSRPMRRRA